MDYFGQVVNKAARVGGYPQGGQVAISDAAFDVRLLGQQDCIYNHIYRICDCGCGCVHVHVDVDVAVMFELMRGFFW